MFLCRELYFYLQTTDLCCTFIRQISLRVIDVNKELVFYLWRHRLLEIENHLTVLRYLYILYFKSPVHKIKIRNRVIVIVFTNNKWTTVKFVTCSLILDNHLGARIIRNIGSITTRSVNHAKPTRPQTQCFDKTDAQHSTPKFSNISTYRKLIPCQTYTMYSMLTLTWLSINLT